MNRTEYPIAVEIKNSEDLDVDFQQYWFSLKRRWLAATVISGAFFTLGFMATLSRSQPYYVATGKILVKPDESATLTGLETESKIKTKLTPLTLQGNPLKTEIEIILSQPILSKVTNALNLVNGKNKSISEDVLKKNLEVKEIKGTDILEISYTSREKKETKFVVNRIMKAYIENNKIVNRSEALTAKSFIAKQLPETKESVLQAEEALRIFHQKNKVVDLESEAKLSLETIEKIKNLIAEAQAKLADTNAQYSALINNLGMNSEEAIIVGRISQSPSIQATLTAIQKLEDELALERTKLQDANPQVMDLSDKRLAIKRQLQKRMQKEFGIAKLPTKNIRAGELEIGLINKLITLQVEKVGLSNQVTSLENNLLSYNERINILPKLEKEERELQRRLKASQSTYETLLKNLEEVEASGNQNIVNARIVEEALEPKIPTFDKQVIFISVANLIVSALMFVTTIIVLEKRDSTLKTVKQIQQIFKYTLLAAIPSFEKRHSIEWNLYAEKESLVMPVLNASNSAISEVYRMLQANLEFMNSHKKPKVIVITSSVNQEGKSTVAANLAVVLTELRKKVLLVDADMRHPSQHHVWQINNEIGLSNVIVGRALITEAITEVISNLDVVTSGVVPPNPVTLLKSQAMSELIEYGSFNYDYMIIDAPPILTAADALILSKISDGILLVSRPGVVDSSSANATKELLKQAEQDVLGLVINGVILENESDSYFHFKNNSKCNHRVTNSRKTSISKIY
ncbi:capsular biosynthesis protein [Calothrix sp. HK-06]|nr:capsular biosynthesis protein [Calothrix sp. HK-06]